MSLTKRFITNWSEIAVRIIGAANELGIKTVQIYSVPFYDPLLGKLIIHADNYEGAIIRLTRAVKELKLGERKTTDPFFLVLANYLDNKAGALHNNWLELWLKNNHGKFTKQEGSLS